MELYLHPHTPLRRPKGQLYSLYIPADMCTPISSSISGYLLTCVCNPPFLYTNIFFANLFLLETRIIYFYSHSKGLQSREVALIFNLLKKHKE